MNDFDRFAPAMAVFYASFGVAVPSLFVAVTLQGGSPVTPEQYGEIVYAIPALVWAGVQLSVGFVGLLAAAFRWPKISLAASSAFFGLMTFFAAAAIIAGPTGTLVVAGSGAGVAPIAAWFASVAWQGSNGRG